MSQRQLIDNVNLAIKLANERGEQLAAIKALVCGDAEPRWPTDPRVTAMRRQIADLCEDRVA
jgi:hypothetical protein